VQAEADRAAEFATWESTIDSKADQTEVDVLTRQLSDVTKNLITNEVSMLFVTTLALRAIRNDGTVVSETNNGRMTTIPKVRNVYRIYSNNSDYTFSLYAYDINGDGIGFYYEDGNSKILSKSSLSWTDDLWLDNIIGNENIESIRLTVRKGNGSGKENWFRDYSPANDIIMCLNSKNYSKNWYVIGDSISFGTYSESGGTIQRLPSIAYTTLSSERLGYNLTNYAVPNLGFTVDATDESFTDLTLPDVLTNHAYDDADLVTIALGTNDYGRDGILGTIADNSSVNSVYGRIKLIVETLQTKCPRARIIFITPIPRETSGTISGRFCMTEPNNNGFTLNAVKEAIITACEYYGIEYINMTDTCVLNYSNYTVYQLDGLHPTITGHAKLADWFINRIF
jgi:lysophospholipase L1-like esterase